MRIFSFPQLQNYLLAKYGHKSYVCKNEPIQICLYVTDRCTLSCKWCLRQSSQGKYSSQRHDMSFEQAKKILQYFPKAAHLSLAGFGEPLMVEHLFKITAEFKKRPMRVSMITNGTLLLDRMDDILHAEFYGIEVSLNSLDAIDYKLTCGGNENTFNNVLKGIQLLAEKRKSAKPYLSLSFVLTRDLFHRTPEIIKFAEEAKVDRLTLHNLIPHDNYSDYTGVLTTDNEEFVAKFSEWKRAKKKVQVDWPRLVKKGLKSPARICKPSWVWLGIDMEGNTAGCSRAMGTCKDYGNVFQEGKEVWNNEFRKKLRASFLKRNEFLFDCCKTCVEIQP
ncbi:MAG: radical SAM/SPASM domain-containing protein [Candidatus Loosdrechtia sp.]|uniref:radical SAM/SPASM domain-containing protein n=1 Tax=Candidatus Loosdrechtia sp. TaxID=3101272 RepID=UPI003A69B618|nr:MAG: radical SAM protein [Candidatus Jettenia sp. AMX2]